MKHLRQSVSCLGLGLALCSGCQPDSTSEQAAQPTEGYVETADGVQLFYRTVGSGGDTIVVLHGGPGFTMHSLLADLLPLAESHTLLFYDQRGSGASTLVSDSASLDARLFAEDLDAIRQAFSLEQLTLLAHSWGGAVAALYAQEFPERIGRLIVVDGTPLTPSHLTQAFELRESRRDSANVVRLEAARERRRADPGDADACRAYYAEYFAPFYGDRGATRATRADFCAGTPESLRNKFQSVDPFTMASVGDWDWRPAVREVSAPALVVHGVEDVIPVEAAREWASSLPESRLLLITGSGHFPYVEAPDEFFPAVEEFLAGRWPEQSEPGGVPQ